MTQRFHLLGKSPSRRSVLIAAGAIMLPGVARAALLATPETTEGPFYPDTMPADDDRDLVRVEGALREAGGDILHLSGRVLDTDAKPVAGARVEIWQCDINGVYLHSGSRRSGDRDAAFQGFGHAMTDSAGRYSFRTIVPVPYSGRTPHIHVKVLQDGRDRLTSQLYRAGHAQNAGDFLFRNLSAAEQGRVSMVLRPRTGSGGPGFETEIDLVIGA